MKASLDAFKCAKLFTPQNIYQMKPDADALGQSLTSVPFLSSPEVISCLKAELPAYIARAADTESDLPPLEWWKVNASALPAWSVAAKKILVLQPSSAAAERVFSLLNNSFNEQQYNSLQDYIETSVMLQINLTKLILVAAADLLMNLDNAMYILIICIVQFFVFFGIH